jgi:hypothetical protein
MLANYILRSILKAIRIILWPVDMALVYFYWLLLRISFGLLSPVYTIIFNVVWFPFSLYIRITVWIYRELFTPRPLLAVISIPLLTILDIARMILPNPSMSDRLDKALIIESWPYPAIGIAAKTPKTEDHSANSCPQCGKHVASNWEVCQFCGEKLDSCPYCGNVIGITTVHCPMCGTTIAEKSSVIRQCPMCGDMVNPEWKKCLRCSEPLV